MIGWPDEAVVDSSVLIGYFTRDAGVHLPVVDGLMRTFIDGDASLLLLDLAAYEMVNVLVRKRRAPADEAAVVLDTAFQLADIVIRVRPDLAARAARIVSATGLSGYDAAFLAAGEHARAPVVTLDDRLAAAGAMHIRELAAR